MGSLTEIREKFPRYNFMSDDVLVDHIQESYMPDMSVKQVKDKLGYQREANVITTPIRSIGQEVERIVPNFAGAIGTLGQVQVDVGEFKPEGYIKSGAFFRKNYDKALTDLQTFAKDYEPKIKVSDKERKSFMLSTIPSALGSSLRFGAEYIVGGSVGSTALMVMDIFGQTFNDISKTQPGWSEKKRMIYAMEQAVPQAILERLATPILIDPFTKIGTTTLRKSLTNGILYKNFYKGVSYGFLSQGAEEGTQELTTNAIDKLYGLDVGLFDNVMQSAFVGGIVGTMFGSVSSMAQNTAIKRYQNELKAAGLTETDISSLTKSLGEYMDKEIKATPEGLEDALKTVNEFNNAINKQEETTTELKDKLVEEGLSEEEATTIASNLSEEQKDNIVRQVKVKETEKQSAIVEEAKLFHGTKKGNKAKILKDGFTLNSVKRNYTYSELGETAMYFTKDSNSGWLSPEAAEKMRAVPYDEVVEVSAEGLNLKEIKTPEDWAAFEKELGIEEGGMKDLDVDEADHETLKKKSSDIIQKIKDSGYDGVDLQYTDMEARGHEVPAGEQVAVYNLDKLNVNLSKQKAKPLTGIETTEGDKVSGLAKRMAKNLKEKYGIDISEDDMIKYQSITNEEQIDKAMKIYNDDPARANRIALGLEKPPEGILPTTFYVIAEKMAIKNKDVDMLQMLATQSSIASDASKMGQTIQMLSQIEENSPLKSIQRVVKARKANFEKSSKKSLKEAIKTEKVKLTNEIEENLWKTLDAGIDSFIKELEC